MTGFNNVRQPALGIQDAAMLPAQSNVNALIQRAIASQAAYVPVTQTFDSTTSTTTLNATVASSQGGSIRSLMIPTGTAGFIPIIRPIPIPCAPCAQNGGCSACQTNQGSSAGMAIFGGAGISLGQCGCGHNCGCGCTRTLADEVVIDEENSNGIDDGTADIILATQKAAEVRTATEVAAQSTVAETTVPAPAAAETIQYVTYNA